ncbi:VOC family protein [Paenibacillus sp. GSMTC-2017]|uniref:VOC family protein n=1 Tax=Paenibacillus sp. GSMTC-2017 TaxID=2794350 RepID=UPI0018D807AA|nr:VOC family protein [Paenibacillus sp. GSMTC-2017]MBH5318298.1 VOC family protein [Paenibacillus sp. GSMTC-2017]
MGKITPFLWFDHQAEEAMTFYISIFKNAEIHHISRVGGSESGQQGPVISGTFQLEGQPFMALNGGPHYSFTPAISLFVSCETQEEVDDLWEKLSEGGKKSRCGWLEDKYGISWQIIPTLLGKLMQDKDAEKAERVMKAMLQMDKIDLAKLQQAYDGEDGENV